MNPEAFLIIIRKQYFYYKRQADQAIAQLTDDQLFHQQDGSNSVAIIVKHISGNLLSRFTDFKQSDGEKHWRDRDQEFVLHSTKKADLTKQWEKAWQVLIIALDSIDYADVDDIVYIRKQPHRISTALIRSITHTASHVGQIIYAAKTVIGHDWKNLSIPLRGSAKYNEASINNPSVDHHYTDYLK